MGKNPDRFGEWSLLWAAGGGVMTGFGLVPFFAGGPLLGLLFLVPGAAGTFAVGGVLALIGLVRGEESGDASIGLLANLAGVAASLVLCLGCLFLTWRC